MFCLRGFLHEELGCCRKVWAWSKRIMPQEKGKRARNWREEAEASNWILGRCNFGTNQSTGAGLWSTVALSSLSHSALTNVNWTPWTLAALYFPSNRVFFLVCFGVMWSHFLATLFSKLQGSVSRHCAEGGLCWSKAKFSASKKTLFSSVKNLPLPSYREIWYFHMAFYDLMTGTIFVK